MPSRGRHWYAQYSFESGLLGLRVAKILLIYISHYTLFYAQSLFKINLSLSTTSGEHVAEHIYNEQKTSDIVWFW